MLITGFAVGPHETNCYLVAARAPGPAIVIDPGDAAVGTLEYYFSVNDLTHTLHYLLTILQNMEKLDAGQVQAEPPASR